MSLVQIKTSFLSITKFSIINPAFTVATHTLQTLRKEGNSSMECGYQIEIRIQPISGSDRFYAMYTNLTKGQAFPLAAKMSSQPRCFNSSHSLKIQSLPFGLYPKPYTKQLLFVSHSFFLMNPINFSAELGNLTNPTRYGLLVRNARQYYLSIRARTLSSSVVRPEKQLPWLASIFA